MTRRQLECTAADVKRWDRAAKLEGISFAAFTRRALEQRCSSIADLEEAAQRLPVLRQRLPGMKVRRASGKKGG